MTTSTRLNVKVAPGASRDGIGGWLGDVLKVRVRAQPEKGKANSAVIALLAKSLGTPARDIVVCSGHTSRLKVVEIRGVSDAELRNRLSQITS